MQSLIENLSQNNVKLMLNIQLKNQRIEDSIKEIAKDLFRENIVDTSGLNLEKKPPMASISMEDKQEFMLEED